MRISCNGCRVLRKGCSENCSIRPCLQWIKSPDSQANATLFLAKFYGRAGLLNLLNAAALPFRPAIFRSLLYEACGRIVNPIYGSVGLLWSGSWQLCQAAVDAVLNGAPITPIPSDTAATGHPPPFKASYDIRHVSKDENSAATPTAAAAKNRCRRPKRTARKARSGKPTTAATSAEMEWGRACCEKADHQEVNLSASHDSSLSHQSEVAAAATAVEGGGGESKDAESMVSEETSEPSSMSPVVCRREIGLELALGFKPAVARASHVMPVKKRKVEGCGTCEDENTCRTELRLDFE